MAAVFGPRQFSTTWIEGTRRRRIIILSALTVGLSLLLARLVLTIDILVVAGMAVLVAVTAICVRPRYGLYLLFGVVLFFDGMAQDPFMLPGRYINFSLQTTLGLNGAIIIPIEVLVLLASALWLAQATMRRQVDFRLGFFGRPILLFGGMLVFGLARGLLSGANPNYSFWESRFLFSMLLAYILTANVIRTRAHVRTLLNLVFVLVSLSAIEGLYRKFALINNGVLGPAQENWFSHEDVVIWGLLIILVFAQQVFGSGPGWRRFVGPFTALAAVGIMLLSERRAGLIAVGIAFAIFTISLITINRKAFLFIAVPALLVAAVYLPVFWNNTSTLGQGARAVRSISSPDPRDAASNAWRDLEAINVRATIASDPLLGIGFGRPFLQIVTVPDISFFEFWDYEAHHNILWVWMKTGALGFTAFFILAMTGIARSIWLAKTLRYPEFRTFALLATSAIVMSLVFCYVDLGLTGTRIPLLLGVALGTVGVLDRIRE
ncbi:MAG TPA: O-antigen ligase family protein [Chloroflexota bacterium]|nr:O-antigen ligase family protein [Chloroflexota bacterium]